MLGWAFTSQIPAPVSSQERAMSGDEQVDTRQVEPQGGRRAHGEQRVVRMDAVERGHGQAAGRQIGRVA
jgi:hypothetical protein